MPTPMALIDKLLPIWMEIVALGLKSRYENNASQFLQRWWVAPESINQFEISAHGVSETANSVDEREITLVRRA